jgi:pimeloyl-ACP methyl ester carboxylesterase
MNDIGPEIAPEGLARIMAYAGLLPEVSNWADAVAQTREIYGQAWPGLKDDEWQKMARRAYRENAAGVPVQDIDKNIGRAIREVGAQTGDPWHLFGALKETPTLLLHGAISDILTQPIIDKMLLRKPDLQVAHIADRGHVPILNEQESIAAIDRFIGGL